MTDMELFFTELEGRLEYARRSDRRRYRNFFAQLQPQLQAAHKLEVELNRHLAHRFNVLDYLRTDELGLSRIIADLLNPNANHGQGPLFLKIFQDRMQVKLTGPSPDLARTKVFVEREIKDKRRVDIYIQIPEGGGKFCLAIENKPYAADQENQVNDYLDYLRGKYGDRFLLIYLSPTGEGPSEWSLPRTELERWRGQLAIMPYCRQSSGEDADRGGNAADVFEQFRVSCSLMDWLAACREKCDVERLRWFLKDIESFCQRKFGGHAMATDTETRTVEEFLYSSPEHLLTAQTIHVSWPAIKERVCKRFLEHLRDRVEQGVKEKLSKFSHDIRVGCKYGGEKTYVNRLWLYRSSWKQYEVNKSDSNRRTSIRLEAEHRGPNGWYYGVSSPLDEKNMSDSDRDRRSRMETALKEEFMGGGSGNWWAVWYYVSAQKRDWNPLLPKLHRECEDNGGEITDYFVSRFLDVAAKAIPIIDKVEGTET